MQVKIQYKLTGQAADWAQALQRQLREETGENMPLSTIAQRLFVRWMESNLLVNQQPQGESSDGLSISSESSSDTGAAQATINSDASFVSPEASTDSQA